MNPGLGTESISIEPFLDKDFILAILHNPHEGIAVIRPDGGVKYLNPGMEKLCGYSAAEVPRVEQLATLVFPDPVDREAVLDDLLRSIETALPVERECRFTHRDRSVRWSRLRLAVTPNGDFILSAHDITQRVQAETTLHESEEKYQRLSAMAPVGIYEIDFIRKKFISVNDVMCTHSGYTREEFLSLNPAELLSEDSRRLFCERLKKLLAGQKVSENVEFEFIKKDGSLLTVLLNNNFIYKQGVLTGSRVILHDITEKKRVLKERRELQKRLALSKKMETLGLLAGGVAHDLNNILSGIISYPELLLMDLPEDSPLRKPLETIQASGWRAAAVVEDLLTIARGAASRKSALCLNQIIRSYLGSPEYKKLSENHPDVAVSAELSEDLMPIAGSPIHIKKVLMNIVSNGMEAIPDVGRIVISTRNHCLENRVKGYQEIPPGSYAVVSITDSGSGIAAEDMEKIFEPFYTKKVMGKSGTGLGLAVVWNTMQDHEGYIDVGSMATGTRFDLYFPTTQTDAPETAGKTPIEKLMGHGEQLLIVDDEATQLEITSRILSRLGYRVATAESGESAIHYMERQTVDLVLLDMIMQPEMGGLEIYQRIIRQFPGQKTIIVSGFTETEEVARAKQLGARAFLKKPYDIETIGTAVQTVLQSGNQPD